MTVVLDTNVIVASLVAQGLCRDLFALLIKTRVVASSQPLLIELEQVIRRKFGLTPGTRNFLAALPHQIRIVEPVSLEKRICRDRDDDLVIATALAASADFIITGDDDLLVLGRFRNVQIVSPRQFWAACVA